MRSYCVNSPRHISHRSRPVEFGMQNVVHHSSRVSDSEASGLDPADGGGADDVDLLLVCNLDKVAGHVFGDALGDDGNGPGGGRGSNFESVAFFVRRFLYPFYRFVLAIFKMPFTRFPSTMRNLSIPKNARRRNESILDPGERSSFPRDWDPAQLYYLLH
jgi:hypothetical protein